MNASFNTLKKFTADNFQDILDLLNQNLEFDFIPEHILREKIYFDPFYDESLIWIEERDMKPVGFIQAVTREIRGVRFGYVKLMVVHKNFRRKGIGRDLYKKVEDIFRERNIDVIRWCDVPLNYFMPGIDPRYTPALAFVEKMGFTRFGDTSNMIVDLSQQNWELDEEISALQKSGIFISRAEEPDREELIEWIEKDWKLWVHEVEMALSCHPKALFVAKKEGKIRAFSAYNGNNTGTGWFGPMGTHPELRGKGTGGVLLKLCLFDIYESGLKQAIIPWVGPIAFYSYHVQARVDRVFWRYQKLLNPDVKL